MKLKFIGKRANRKGYILVSVVVFSMIISIGICGLIGLSRNDINQEIAAFNEDKAFLAAESGLLIGTRWLRDTLNWNVYHHSGYPGYIFNGPLGGLDAKISYAPDENGKLMMMSSVSSAGLGYTKVLSWSVEEAKWGNPGIFINNCSHAGSVGGTGFNNEWFDGPMHANSPIYISSVSGGNASVKFVNGNVTVHNKTEKISFDDGGNWGNYDTSEVSGNDYEFGIWHHDAHPGDYAKIDAFFERNGSYESFKHTTDSMFVPRITTQTITLPLNEKLTKTAILNFYVENGTGKADYYYYNSANVQLKQTYNVDGQVIRAPNTLNVLGTVKGQVTVVTNEGYHINPVGDIMYASYQPNVSNMEDYNNEGNYGLGKLSPTNEDVLALVSGGDINFKLDKYELLMQSGKAVLSAIPANGQNKPPMYVTAQLMATEKGRGIRWESSNVNDYNFRLRALGTRAIDIYEESHNAQGGPGAKAFMFFYDSRFSDGLNAPGVNPIRASTTNGELFVIKTDWQEENLVN